jgi:WD40 repeat protein
MTKGANTSKVDLLAVAKRRRRRQRLIRMGVTFVGMALLLSLGVAWYIRKQRQEAEKLDQSVTRHEARTLRGHEHSVNAIAVSPDGKTLSSGSGDNTVRLWDVASGQNLVTLKGHNDIVNSVAFSPDGKTLASASVDKTLKLWDVASGQNVAALEGNWLLNLGNHVRSVAFSPDGKTLVSASADKTIKLWEAARYK